MDSNETLSMFWFCYVLFCFFVLMLGFFFGFLVFVFFLGFFLGGGCEM